MTVLWRPDPSEHYPINWALGEFWLWGVWTHGLRKKRHNTIFLNSVELFIKNIPAVKLDPVLPETILISLSQVTLVYTILFQNVEMTFMDHNCLVPPGG